MPKSVVKQHRSRRRMVSVLFPHPSGDVVLKLHLHSAQLIPTVSYVSDKGKEKASEGTNASVNLVFLLNGVDGRSTASQDSLAPQNPVSSGSAMLTTELQFARCMSNRYRSEQFPRCVSCTRRWAGDTCRFQGIRFFLKDQHRNIVGISFVESQKPDAPSMNFPTQWNISLKPEHIRSTKVRLFHLVQDTSLKDKTADRRKSSAPYPPQRNETP